MGFFVFILFQFETKSHYVVEADPENVSNVFSKGSRKKKEKTRVTRGRARGTQGEAVRQCGVPVLGNMGEGRRADGSFNSSINHFN